MEVTKLNDLTSQEMILALEKHFGRHRIPGRLITDCGVQYTSKESTDFARSYNFEHVLVSPKQMGKQKLQLNSEVPVEEKREQEQSASRLQSHPHPRDRLVSISALHGLQAKDHLTNGNWSTET